MLTTSHLSWRSPDQKFSLKNQMGNRITNDAIDPGNNGIYPIPNPEQINL